MNYTLKDANKIRVGDTLTLKDGSVHSAIEYTEMNNCDRCTMSEYDCVCRKVLCVSYNFHFKRIKP